MKVYKLDEKGNYIKEHNCQKCPITGDWLYPTYYTDIAPPEEKEFTDRQFIKGLWIESENNTGRIIYNTETVIPERCTEKSIPKGYTKDKPFDYPCKWDGKKWIDDKDGIYQLELNNCLNNRRAAYALESDGLFFDYQRGEIEKSVWESKVEEIKKRYPKPEKP